MPIRQRGIIRALVGAAFWLVLSLAVVAYALWDKVADERIQTKRLDSFTGVTADRVWFNGSDQLLARSVEGGELLLWSVPVPAEGAEPQKRTFSVGTSNPDLVAVEPSGSRVAWVNNGQIFLEHLKGFLPKAAAEAPPGTYLLALSSDGFLIAVGPGKVSLFDSNRLQALREASASVHNPDTIEVAGSYVALADRSTGEATVIDLRSSRLQSVEYRHFNSRLSAVAVSITGRLAAATMRGTLEAASPLAAPGAVRGIDFFAQDRFLVVGEFPDAHMLTAAKAPVVLARSASGAVSVASSGSHIALAGRTGLEVHSYAYAFGLTERGRKVLMTWSIITAILSIFFVVRMSSAIWDKIKEIIASARSKSGNDGKEPSPETLLADLAEPSAEILEDIRNRECVLVVGEELSKPCGMPVWKSFVQGLIEWLEDSRNLEPAVTEKLRQEHRRGRVDFVAEAIIDKFPGRTSPVMDYARSLYVKPAPLSNVHEAAGRVRFAGAITANLDNLLEKAMRTRHSEVFVPGESTAIPPLLDEKQLFLLKLRGCWNKPESIVIHPGRAAVDCASNSAYADLIKDLLGRRTLLFLGMSIEEIDGFLSVTSLVSPSARRHLALIVKKPNQSKNVLQRLRKGYGVAALSYAPDDSQKVCDFLDKCAQSQFVASTPEVSSRSR